MFGFSFCFFLMKIQNNIFGVPQLFLKCEIQKIFQNSNLFQNITRNLSKNFNFLQIEKRGLGRASRTMHKPNKDKQTPCQSDQKSDVIGLFIIRLKRKIDCEVLICIMPFLYTLRNFVFRLIKKLHYHNFLKR